MNIIVQYMNKNFLSQDLFNILRKINKNKQSQRKLANELGFSLGKLNYCLRQLRLKGLVKLNNFSKNPNKFDYAYVLTPRGISEKTKLTLAFMKRKIEEYEELRKEIEDK